MGGSNGEGPRKRLPPQVEAVLKMTARQIAADLHQMYPLHPQQQVSQLAMGLAQEQFNVQPLLETCTKKTETHWKLNLVKPSVVAGADAKGLTITAPIRVEGCASLEEVLKSITVFALLTNPSARAILAMHGYRLSVGAGSKKADVIPLHPKSED